MMVNVAKYTRHMDPMGYLTYPIWVHGTVWNFGNHVNSTVAGADYNINATLHMEFFFLEQDLLRCPCYLVSGL